MDENSLVNRCVRKAFGRFYRGDWETVGEPYNLSDVHGDEPAIIGRRSLIALLTIVWPPYFHTCSEAGRFVKADGSKLRVLKKFLPQAEEYRKIYEEETGKKVEIEVLGDGENV